MKESESHSVAPDSSQTHGLYSSWNSPGQNSGVGSLSLLQGIFPTQGLNPVLLHCRQILYQLSHKGGPRILESGSLFLLQGIFPTQELNQGLLHCRQILYQLSHKEISELWQLEQKSFHSKLSFRLDSFHKKLHSHPILHMKASTMLWVKMNFFSTYCK